MTMSPYRRTKQAKAPFRWIHSLYFFFFSVQNKCPYARLTSIDSVKCPVNIYIPFSICWLSIGFQRTKCSQATMKKNNFGCFMHNHNMSQHITKCISMEFWVDVFFSGLFFLKVSPYFV